MEKRYYIAYGSNLNIPQMRTRCPGARIIGTSAIEGYRLLFKGSRTGSYLTIEPHEGAGVPVAAWEVSAENEAALDRYEGFPTFANAIMVFVYFSVSFGNSTLNSTFWDSPRIISSIVILLSSLLRIHQSDPVIHFPCSKKRFLQFNHVHLKQIRIFVSFLIAQPVNLVVLRSLIQIKVQNTDADTALSFPIIFPC